MIKKGFLLCLLVAQMLGVASVEEVEWVKNETFLKFLDRQKLPTSLYWDLDYHDKELATEIREGQKYQILWNDDNQIEQVLIPINGSDLQIHIYKDLEGKYVMIYSPISYDTQTRVLRLQIENSAYQDVENATGSTPVARAMLNAFAGSMDFRAMQKGDEVLLLYERKERMGQRFGDIVLKMATIEVNKKAYKVFFYKDSYFDTSGKEMESFLLITPVKFTRISSHFTRARYHPILKKYRAHLGVDYAAPHGTPVKSAGSGVISFVGTKTGYGKTVIVRHGSGYSTLYAHLSRFASIRSGQKVAQGQHIAYVGSSGLSTGAHLHFGLYLNNKAINPFSMVKITKAALKGNDKEEFAKVMAAYEAELQGFIDTNNTTPPKELGNFEKTVEF